MTVTILKPGNKNRIHPTRRFVCRKCLCEFTAQEADFTGTIPDDRAVGIVHKYLVCPERECGETIYWAGHADKDVDGY